MSPHLPLQPRRHTAQLAVLVAAAVLTSCGTSTTDESGHADPPAEDPHQIGHIHGLGTDPADGTLYVAGHLGVFRIDENGTPTRVADRWQDTMAFTITGPNTFLGSGHPDLREDLPPHLGLIESTDAGETWRSLSLQGEADFHALEVVGDRIFGYDAISGRLVTTTDRSTWTTLAQAQIIDLAAVPDDAEKVLATTPSGELLEITLDGTTRSLTSSPKLVFIDATHDTLVGVTGTGEVYRSTQPARRWTAAGQVSGTPGALDATDTAWHIATDEGVFASTDDGERWTKVVASEH